MRCLIERKTSSLGALQAVTFCKTQPGTPSVQQCVADKGISLGRHDETKMASTTINQSVPAGVFTVLCGTPNNTGRLQQNGMQTERVSLLLVESPSSRPLQTCSCPCSRSTLMAERRGDPVQRAPLTECQSMCSSADFSAVHGKQCEAAKRTRGGS